MPTIDSPRIAELNRVSELFKMLGHPKRLQLLYLLIQNSMSVTEIREALDWEQSAVSHQLRLLRSHHLVHQQRRGKTMIYKLADPLVMTFIVDAISQANAIMDVQDKQEREP